ncbi:hypothetical protein NML43_24615 [Rhodopseudomonas palustris]|uniref:hypothetical protein n=1 Tax=Rhodopseudomonas palustris TaxID=1076 RepID=UPI0020CDE368|nr:hypothetical protein [Rhodopseudomonas palustris]MCP9630288.1 hypothetical protein [Rhodopseudomonas palustris]
MNNLEIPSFLVAAMKLSIQLNGIFIPFKQTVDNLQRFCRPLMLHNEDPLFDLSNSGSSLLFRLAGRNFILCTRHQLTNQHRAPKDVVLIVDNSDGRKVALTPNETNFVQITLPEQINLSDIFIAEYASTRNGRDVQSQFLSFDINAMSSLREIPPELIVIIFAIGYPSRFSSFEPRLDDEEGLPEGLDIVSRWAKLYLEQTTPSAWDREYRIPLKLHHNYHADIGDPDGFSGSPVFFIYQDSQKNAHLGFAGMITDANKSGRFNIYEATYIRMIMTDIIANPATHE